MFERILVPLDGSPLAEAILTQLRPVLLRKDAEILFVQSVAPPLGMEGGGAMMLQTQLASAQEYLGRMVQELSSQGVRARFVFRLGGPAPVILAVAEEERASLIALATHGRTGFSRFVLGSVAEKVVRASPVPVLAVRSFGSDATPIGPKPLSIRKILVAVDASNYSLDVVAPAVEMAKLFEAEAVVLNVCEGHPQCAVPVPQLNYACEHFEAAGVRAAPVMRIGDPAVQILEECRAQSAGLIAMATHGRSGPSRWVLGSVAEKVLRASSAPLLLARSGSVSPGGPKGSQIRESASA